MPGEAATTDDLPIDDQGAVVLTPDLGGNVPCAVCGYSLRGLSIRSVCPECGTTVRATLLAIVDPKASELRPIPFPKLTAFGVALWALAGFLAATTSWAMRLSDVLAVHFRLGFGHVALPRIGTVLVALSGLGAFALIRPHAGLARKQQLITALAVGFGFTVIALLYWDLHAMWDAWHLPPYVEAIGSVPERSMRRLAMAGVLAATLWGLWPHAEMLIARSVLMRTGQVDTQPLSSMLAVLAIAAAGDVSALIGFLCGGTVREVFGVIEVVLIAVGSFLFTLGLFGLMMDMIRLRTVILKRPLGLSDVLARQDA